VTPDIDDERSGGDLIAFIAARLGEDEAAAKAWQSPPWREDATSWKVVGRREPRYDNGRSETLTVIDVSGRPVDFAEAIQVKWDSNGERATHIARHDPARVLREVAAKQAILAEHELVPAGYRGEGVLPGEYGCRTCDVHEGGTDPGGPCKTVRLIVSVWSDHDDYDPAWAPEA
jgi:hypothetical protein